MLYVLSPLNCPTMKELPRELTDDLPFERRPPLSDTSVQYVGQHLAVVVADSLEQATPAASLLHFEYEPEPAILSAVQAVNAVSPSLGEGRVRQASYLPDHFVKLTEEKLQDTRGHADRVAEAFRIVQTYTTRGRNVESSAGGDAPCRLSAGRPQRLGFGPFPVPIRPTSLRKRAAPVWCCIRQPLVTGNKVRYQQGRKR